MSCIRAQVGLYLGLLLFPVALLANGPLTFEISLVRDVTYNGVAIADVTGRDVAAGDINGDGIDDLVIGVRQADPGGRTDAGRVYIYFGPLPRSGTVELSGGASIIINGIQAGDEAGIGVAIGDINHDLAPDLIIGARWADPGGKVDAGQAYVVFGPLNAGVYELSQEADITVNAIAAGDELGVGVASGDVNNDGLDDLIVGARHADREGVIDTGEAYVLFGPLGPGTIELSQRSDVTLQGENFDDKSGYGLGTGDVNGDQKADLIVGAWSNDANGKLDAGRAYIFFGPLSPGTRSLATANVVINGIDPEDHLGVDASLGDINGDGIADVMLGATEADPPGRDKAGEAYVLFGPLRSGIINLGFYPHLTFNGIDAVDYFGIGLASGDLNRDGLPDMVFSAFRADPGGRTNAGEVYVVYGRCAGQLPTKNGTAGNDTLIGTPGNDVIVGLGGNDTINGLGGNDIICGGPGYDTLVGSIGNDILLGGPGNDLLTAGEGDDIIKCGSGFDVADGGNGIDTADLDCEVKQNSGRIENITGTLDLAIESLSPK